MVKCNQSGKYYKTSFDMLSTDDGKSLTETDLEPNAQLLMDHNAKSYPVTVDRIENKDSNGEGKLIP